MKNEKDAKRRKGGFADMHEGWQPEVLDLSEEDLEENAALSKEFEESELDELFSITDYVNENPDSALAKLIGPIDSF
jgi:hypothetical protein